MRDKEPVADKLFIALSKEYQCLNDMLEQVPKKLERNQIIPFTGREEGMVSIADLIAYQIGWGKALISWYKAGLKVKHPEMPLKGFTWDYSVLAQHFYEQYEDQSFAEIRAEFAKTVQQILKIISAESATGHLYEEGIWPWCKLKNGKEWPLSKWIQINTVAPYKRAIKLIRASLEKDHIEKVIK